MKPVWETYLRLIEVSSADGAFQKEEPVNGGHYVLLPSPASISLTEQWARYAPTAIKEGQHDQVRGRGRGRQVGDVM